MARDRTAERIYKQGHREQIRANSKKYYQNHREHILAQTRQHQQEVKREVLSHYGNGNLVCVVCGEKDIRVLCIDHIDGGGNKHREKLRLNGGYPFYRYLKIIGFPEGFQVLCANCNLRKVYARLEEI